MVSQQVERKVLLIAVTIIASLGAVVLLNLVCIPEHKTGDKAVDFTEGTVNTSPEFSKYLSRCSIDTPVLQAVIKSDIALVRQLIAQGADVNISNLNGCSPLLVAVGSENLEMVELLLEAGADVDADNHKGFTPLMAASCAENWDMQKMLHIHAYGNDGSLPPCRFSPTAPILRTGDLSLIKELIAKGEDVNVYGLFHWTLLHAYASAGDRETVELLLDAGAEVNVTDRRGITPLDRAANKDIEKLLKSHGAKTDKELQQEDK
jgi:ankyrin repeat protein